MNGQCIATTQAMYSVASSAHSLETTVSVLTGLTVFLVLACAGAVLVALRLGAALKRLTAQQPHTVHPTSEREF
ncbi:hypothetical protein [Streptomyces kanamyceticus]|uniref:Uncharacterized protein n=1 Tax=Streptomyces kanamyceticus TaxID=1967 RepID=A0A5J6GCL1_STRKN|nr:hypothetical protein [Streptomyces kanamyceticus]QEU92863.1 hypothetical protein CP970_19840 [Streptomyces kanamyceticus]